MARAWLGEATTLCPASWLRRGACVPSLYGGQGRGYAPVQGLLWIVPTPLMRDRHAPPCPRHAVPHASDLSPQPLIMISMVQVKRARKRADLDEQRQRIVSTHAMQLAQTCLPPPRELPRDCIGVCIMCLHHVSASRNAVGASQSSVASSRIMIMVLHHTHLPPS